MHNIPVDGGRVSEQGDVIDDRHARRDEQTLSRATKGGIGGRVEAVGELLLASEDERLKTDRAAVDGGTVADLDQEVLDAQRTSRHSGGLLPAVKCKVDIIKAVRASWVLIKVIILWMVAIERMMRRSIKKW